MTTHDKINNRISNHDVKALIEWGLNATRQRP